MTSEDKIILRIYKICKDNKYMLKPEYITVSLPDPDFIRVAIKDNQNFISEVVWTSTINKYIVQKYPSGNNKESIFKVVTDNIDKAYNYMIDECLFEYFNVYEVTGLMFKHFSEAMLKHMIEFQ